MANRTTLAVYMLHTIHIYPVIVWLFASDDRRRSIACSAIWRLVSNISNVIVFLGLCFAHTWNRLAMCHMVSCNCLVCNKYCFNWRNGQFKSASNGNHWHYYWYHSINIRNKSHLRFPSNPFISSHRHYSNNLVANRISYGLALLSVMPLPRLIYIIFVFYGYLFFVPLKQCI